MKKVIKLILLFSLTICTCGFKWPWENNASNSKLKIHYLSVGQADAAIIECGGHYAMIDCGNDSIVENNFNSYKIDLYLQQENITEFDYIFCSHYDNDHYDGFKNVLDNRTFHSVYGPDGWKEINTRSMKSFESFLKKYNKRIKIPKKGNSFSLGRARIVVLALNSGKSSNDTSLVLMVSLENKKFLFMGDGESKTENALLSDEKIDVKCDVLKVAHHGSSTSTSSNFLAKAKPKYAIISCAQEKDLPDNIVLSRLEAIQTKTFRTDEKGIIICETDGKQITIKDTNGNTIN